METAGPGIQVAINWSVAAPALASEGTWKSIQYSVFWPGQPTLLTTGNSLLLKTIVTGAFTSW
jgi:hypothetical protein